MNNNNNNSNSVFGAGFDDFLQAQAGGMAPTSPQPQNSNTSAPNTNTVDQGFLDFLSGQEGTTASPTANTTAALPSPPVVSPPPTSVATDRQQSQNAGPPPPTASQHVTSAPPVSSPGTVATSYAASKAPAVESEATTTSSLFPDAETLSQLAEIKKKFSGTWRLVRSDPYDEYLKAIGVGLINRKLANSGIPRQLFEVVGSEIRVGFHSSLHNQNYVFKLNQETENLVEKEPQSVFCNYKDGKLILHMTPINHGFAKVQEVTRFINEVGEHVVIYSSGSAMCRRYFQRLITPVN